MIAILALAGACAVFPRGSRGGGGGSVTVAPPVEVRHPWLRGIRMPRTVLRPRTKEEEAIVTDVEKLLTSDFSEYPHAAHRLVGRGEVVVAYLGHAFDHFEMDASARVRIAIVLEPVLQDLAPDGVRRCLESPYVAVRTAGAVAVGERRLAELAPRLVDLLDDDHVAVRRASVAALRKLSNVFYGFHPEASRRSRAGAVAKWRALWGTG